MGEISNRTLAVLVILAILVSLLSLFVGRMRIVTVGGPTQTPGTVQATVLSDIDIRTDGSIDFGNVIAGTSYSSVDLGGTKYIKVASVGSSSANIGYQADNALFFKLGPPAAPGTDNTGRDSYDNAYNISIWSAAGETLTGFGVIANCNTMTVAGPLGGNRTVNISTSTTPLNTDQRIAQNCAGGSIQGFKFAIHIRVPDQETLGARTSILTFTGTAY